MTAQKTSSPPSPDRRWIPLSTSIAFLFKKKRLLGLSVILFLVMAMITWCGYFVTVEFIGTLTGDFFMDPPETATIWGWVKHKGWLVLKWLFLIISHIAAFYLSFLTAYALTSPGYVMLSTAAEKLHTGIHYQIGEALTIKTFFIDLFEAVKIGVFGIFVTIVAFAVSFIPGFGPIIAFLLYAFYSALMFVDYPTSRRQWSLGKKISWIIQHKTPAFRLGVLPAAVSMIPLLNIFFIALLFPLLTVHTTLNFTLINKEKAENL